MNSQVWSPGTTFYTVSSELHEGRGHIGVKDVTLIVRRECVTEMLSCFTPQSAIQTMWWLPVNNRVDQTSQ